MLEKIRTKLSKIAGRSAQIPRIAFYRIVSNNIILGDPKRLQPVQSLGKGKITCEQDVEIGFASSPLYFSTYAYLEARQPTSSILIGEGSRINNNFCAIAEHVSIVIGKNCLIGLNVEIFDSDFHGINYKERRISKSEWARPVRIGDNVFIGSNAKIMKGVNVGDGSVIASGSIVVKNIPAGVIAGGNPAEVLKEII